MGAPPEVRTPIENERMMMLYQPVLGRSLDAIEDGEDILLSGYASVGNLLGVLPDHQSRRSLLRQGEGWSLHEGVDPSVAYVEVAQRDLRASGDMSMK